MVNVNTKVYNSKTGDLVTTGSQQCMCQPPEFGIYRALKFCLGTVVPLYESHSLKVSSPMHHKVDSHGTVHNVSSIAFLFRRALVHILKHLKVVHWSVSIQRTTSHYGTAE